MRIVFMGTPEFSVEALQNLIENGHEICGVYTRPPSKSGRGKKVRISDVHKKANELKLNVFTPKTLKDNEVQNQLFELKPDLIVVVAYGLFLPKIILDFCPCFNIHASLLPKYRGAAPIQRAIFEGETYSGVTIMRMDEGMDTGDMVIKESVKLNKNTNAGILHDQLKVIGGRLIVDAINLFINDKITYEKQDDNMATYAKKITSKEEQIDWSQDAESISRHIRAFSPYPCVYFEYNSSKIKIIETQINHNIQTDKPYGTVIDSELNISTSSGVIRPTIIQRQGKKPMKTSEVLNGFPIYPDTNLNIKRD